MRASTEELIEAVAEAQRGGAKRRWLQSKWDLPLRWVELEDPAAVYLPDVRTGPAMAFLPYVVLIGFALLLLFLALLGFLDGDLVWGGVSLLLALGLAGVSLAMSRREDQRARQRHKGVERRGLYITPDRLVSVSKKEVREFDRPDVIAFQYLENRGWWTLKVRFRDAGRERSFDLMDMEIHAVLPLLEAWHEGVWPLPLPGQVARQEAVEVMP